VALCFFLLLDESPDKLDQISSILAFVSANHSFLAFVTCYGKDPGPLAEDLMHIESNCLQTC
jgi:hypothetical protein